MGTVLKTARMNATSASKRRETPLSVCVVISFGKASMFLELLAS